MQTLYNVLMSLRVSFLPLFLKKIISVLVINFFGHCFILLYVLLSLSLIIVNLNIRSNTNCEGGPRRVNYDFSLPLLKRGIVITMCHREVLVSTMILPFPIRLR